MVRKSMSSIKDSVEFALPKHYELLNLPDGRWFAE